MTSNQGYRTLLHRSVIATGSCILAVVICYFWVDRAVAFFVCDHHINGIKIFRWLTYPPPEVQNWSALTLTVLIVRRAWGPFLRWQKVLFVACISLIVADTFRISLGDVFGRYWPETWTHDNPSLIGTGTYGFHPFQRGDDVSSFPSGTCLQDPGVRRGVDDRDAWLASRGNGAFRSHAGEPCGNELPLRQ